MSIQAHPRFGIFQKPFLNLVIGFRESGYEKIISFQVQQVLSLFYLIVYSLAHLSSHFITRNEKKISGGI